MSKHTNKVTIDGFDNRGTLEYPFGFIVFTDGLRVGYAPNTRGADEDGLFDAHQPYTVRLTPRRPSPTHYAVARTWAKELNAKLAALAEAKAAEEAAEVTA
jgi:hypothetical protein